jgi:ligand-binding sensor domain-containing protein
VERRQEAVLLLAVLLVCWPSAFALDPSLDVNQYAHTTWKITEGFTKGSIWSIAQTPDGYLWLGTEFGLLRFDGVRAVPWQPRLGQQLPSSDIRSLHVGHDGSLWIGTYCGLVSWKDGQLTQYPALDGLIIEWVLQDRDGTSWVIAGRALRESRLCSVQKERTHCYGADRGAGFGITTLYEDSRGVLWAGGMKGVWRWNPGPPKFYPMAGPEERTFGLTETDDGSILIARRGGLTKLRDGKFERYPFPPGLRFSPSKLLRDRDGGLWIGALVDQGLLHIHKGKTDLYTSPEGVFGDLSGHQVRCFFEDREGSIWVSTPSGLDRFREFAIPAVSVAQGLSSRGISSVLAGKDGSIWLGTSDGLNRWKTGRVEIYRNRSGPLNSTLGGFTTGQFAEPGTTTHQIVDPGFPPEEVTSLFQDEAGRIWVSTLEGVAFLESDGFVRVRTWCHIFPRRSASRVVRRSPRLCRRHRPLSYLL